MPPHPKFFEGSSDDLDALHDAIAKWMAESGVNPVNILINVQFHVEDRKWHILCVVMYEDGLGQIRIPGIISKIVD